LSNENGPSTPEPESAAKRPELLDATGPVVTARFSSIDHGDRSDFTAQWKHWHRELESRRARPHGFLAITGLHWLDDQERRFDDVPGTWSSDATGVRVVLGEGQTLEVGDHAVRGDYRFDNVDELGIAARFGDALVEVGRRDGHFMIRPRHPDHGIRANYAGTPTYPPSVDWVVRGSFVAYDAPRPITVGASVEGLTHVYESSGEVEFTLEGHVHRLVAFNGEGPDELFFVFADATSGTTSYAACRFLTADAPGPDRHVTLDFNRATNPPCAYTDFATCPLPPPGNHLDVRVEAGEKLPVSAH